MADDSPNLGRLSPEIVAAMLHDARMQPAHNQYEKNFAAALRRYKENHPFTFILPLPPQASLSAADIEFLRSQGIKADW